MDQDNNIRSFIPKPPTSLEKAQPGANRIIAVMVADILTLAPPKDAEALYRKACAYRDGDGVPQDHAEAFRWFGIAAEKGHADAQVRLGECYHFGTGIAQDYAQAFHWFRMAAQQGHAEAQIWLDVCYEGGEGVPQDASQAVHWFRKAAEQGDAGAQNILGSCYEHGEDVHRDLVEAAKWYRKAAEQDLASTQIHLGNMYSKGLGVPRNYLLAYKWYRKAAEQCFAQAQCNLGVMYSNGEGVPKNNVAAYKWYNLAAAQGDGQSANNRRLIEREMTPTQIAEVQRLSAQFVPRKAGEEPAPETSPSPSTISAAATAFFVTEDGYALTSYHVVSKAARIQLWTGSSTFPARLVKSDPANDLALLKVSGKFLALPLQASRGVELGETVFTLGFPNITLQGMEPKVTEGKISSLSGVQDDPRYFQISVAVQPGNSGGALVNSKGNVVGVVAAKLSVRAALATSGSLPENVNYAVKSSYALLLLESVSEVSVRLREPKTRERKFEELVQQAQAATALVIVGE
jgi:TPR repeat protein